MSQLRTTFTTRRMAVALAVLAALAALSAAAVPLGYRRLVSHPGYWAPLNDAGITRLTHWLTASAVVAALGLASAAWAAHRRRTWSLAAVRWLLVPAYVMTCLYLVTTVRVIDLTLDLALPVGDGTLDLVAAAWLKWRYNLPALLVGVALTALHLLTWRNALIAECGGSGRAAGGVSDDRHGVPRIGRQDDPTYRSSLVGSVVVHVSIILLLPWILQTRGCTALEYAIPGGGGGGGGGGEIKPQVVKLIKKPPVRRKFIFRTNAAITFRVPKLDDSQVAETVEQMTQNEYVANTANATGPGDGSAGEGFGKGGGKGGGWPGGKDAAPIRFIRLQYKGERWDDGMDNSSRADVNFLEELRKASGLKVARSSESVTASQLRSFKKGMLPPFIFMTGEGNIEASEGDIRAIRQYLQDGGMILADCGSPQWHNSFRDFMSKVLPDKGLLDIANDDPIFRTWFQFPNGAPPLWHHGGSRALGVKIDGRWAVFYFPGDMNDAWKTGHNDANPAVVRQAYQLGVNVVKYAVDQYWSLSHAPKPN